MRAAVVVDAPKFLEGVNRQGVHVSVRGEMTLRDDVLEI